MIKSPKCLFFNTMDHTKISASLLDRSTTAASDLCFALRRTYPVFSYNAFRMFRQEMDLGIEFDFSIGDDLEFHPSLLLKNAYADSPGIELKELEGLAFHLGLVESLSYWKTTCSPVIQVNCGHLNDEQRNWWRDLLLNGMGEFFYTNKIEIKDESFVDFLSNGGMPVNEPLKRNLQQRSMVPVGGGRDSAFTLHALSNGSRSFRTMMLNPTPAAIRVAAIVNDHNPIIIERTLDPLLLEMNNRGFLNGHTPFSAYLAFLSALCLAVYDYSEIVIANERSANEPNARFSGRDVNHQYSKSLAFEEHFDLYLSRYLITTGRYFSFIRSMYELQIAKAFATIPEMFSSFRSCNKLQRQDMWCGRCAKCASVYITSFPFIDRNTLREIFGNDLFELQSTVDIVRALEGKASHRPLDCICTVDETFASLYMAISQLEDRGESLPLALEQLRADVYKELTTRDLKEVALRLLSSRGPDRLPSYFTERLNESTR